MTAPAQTADMDTVLAWTGGGGQGRFPGGHGTSSIQAPTGPQTRQSTPAAGAVTKGAAQEPAVRKPELVRLADVEAKAVSWLWEPFIPAGMLTMLSGDPGSGKSFIALSICADLTRGKLRDGRTVEPQNCLYLSVENPIAESIRPRFDSLGGDPSRFYMLNGSVFCANGEEQKGAVTLADTGLLEQAIVETKAKLICIDPIQSFLGANIDLHRANETRPVLDGLSKLAE